MKQAPRILCIGGQDPTGGAGIQADIETVTALGCRALSLVTALTAQDTRNIVSILPTPAEFFTLQLETLLHDIGPDAIKIGLIGSDDLIAPIRDLLQGSQVPSCSTRCSPPGVALISTGWTSPVQSAYICCPCAPW